MKALDKIYAITQGSRIIGCSEKPFKYSEEYIRKDTLLEWANGKITIEGATEGIVGGYDLAMKDLIEYIEKVPSKPKQVRILEREFDGYNSIVVTLDKYVLEGIGVYRNNKVLIQIQREED